APDGVGCRRLQAREQRGRIGRLAGGRRAVTAERGGGPPHGGQLALVAGDTRAERREVVTHGEHAARDQAEAGRGGRRGDQRPLACGEGGEPGGEAPHELAPRAGFRAARSRNSTPRPSTVVRVSPAVTSARSGEAESARRSASTASKLSARPWRRTLSRSTASSSRSRRSAGGTRAESSRSTSRGPVSPPSRAARRVAAAAA